MNKLRELIEDQNKTLSHTKLWSNIANFCATISFLYYSFKFKLEVDILVTYLSIVGLQRFGSKFLDNKSFEIKDKDIDINK